MTERPEQAWEATVQRAREIPIEEIIARYVELRPVGANLKGICPFHNDTSPSLTVSVERQYAKCFSCSWAGDGIQFVREHLEFGFAKTIRTVLME